MLCSGLQFQQRRRLHTRGAGAGPVAEGDLPADHVAIRYGLVESATDETQGELSRGGSREKA
jgi:hypothetical protein